MHEISIEGIVEGKQFVIERMNIAASEALEELPEPPILPAIESKKEKTKRNRISTRIYAYAALLSSNSLRKLAGFNSETVTDEFKEKAQGWVDIMKLTDLKRLSELFKTVVDADFLEEGAEKKPPQTPIESAPSASSAPSAGISQTTQGQ